MPLYFGALCQMYHRLVLLRETSAIPSLAAQVQFGRDLSLFTTYRFLCISLSQVTCSWV